jgi:thiol:disulfide interchange protein DsbD
MNPSATLTSFTPGQRPGSGPLPRRDYTKLVLIGMLLAFILPGVALAAPRKARLTAALNVQNLAADSTAAVAVTIDVPKGLHAQSNKPLDPNLIAFTIKLNDGPATLANVVYPDGAIENYPALGKVSVYTGKMTAYVIIHVPKDATPGDAKIAGTVRYQMCDDDTCFAPVNDTFTIDTKLAPAGSPTPAANEELFKGLDPAQLKSAPATQAAAPTEPSAPQASGMEGPTSLASAIGFALLAGLIFNVMPCVLPVLPLKAIGFYEVSQHNRAKSISYGLVFSLGIIATFAALALLVLPVAGPAGAAVAAR